MANRTVKDASSIHGTNPQYLVEKIIRTRIYDSKYWKEECFALTAELLVDKAMGLRYIGGVFGGNIKPSPFLCLILKMLQIQPEKDIVIEFIKQDEFKYVRALGCFYLRLVHSSLDCYKYLGPLLNDYRKLRLMDRSGVFQLSYMDQFIDNLLREERFCDVIMPRIQKRWVHEANNELEPRVSLLEDDLDDLESESEDEDDGLAPGTPPLPPSPHRRTERSRHSPAGREKRRHSPSPPPEINKRRRDKDRDRGTRDNRDRSDARRHRDTGRGERDRGAVDHYGNNTAEAYHDYHHGGGHEYHGNMPNSTDYHHRRPQQSNGAAAPHHMGDSYHQSHRGGGGDSYHRGGAEDYQHGRGGGGGGADYYHREGVEDYHHRGDDHPSRKRDHRKADEGGRRGEESGRKGGMEESGRREDRKKEGREREGRKKEGRSRRDGGGSLQAEIDEANALRAKLGLPPLK